MGLMILAVPMVSAQPISILQENVHSLKAIRPVAKAPLIYRTKKPAGKTSYGIASWYSQTDPGINIHTANGEVFNDSKLTCASWHYAFGTLLKIENEKNGKSIICRVNDRGPAKRLNRAVDLTKEAFRRIAFLHQGLIRVSVTPLTES